jgi:hypothetical protein
VTRLRARRPGRAARLAWMLPAAGTVLLVAALAWAAVASAHHQAWLGGPPAWRHALRPAAAWTLPVLAVLWAGALALYWWPRRHQRQPISLVALLSMVIVGVILAEASFLPCTGSQAPVIAPQSWVLALFTGQMEGRFGGAVCPGPPPLAMQLARVVCLGATFTGVAAAAAVLWRAEIDRLKTRFVGELTVMTGLDEMTVALLGRLVTEPGRGQVVLVEADPNHPLLEEARATGARVIIADPGQAGALRPVLIHLGRPAVRQVFALHPGAHDNETILAGVRQALGQVRRRTDHAPHVVARIDDPRHADTWRGDHIGAHQLWLEDALSPYETTAVFAVQAVLAHRARTLVLCGDTTLALAILIEAARSAWERQELREAAEAGGQPGSGPGAGFPEILVMADRAADLQREFSATAAPHLRAALPEVKIAAGHWRGQLLPYLDTRPAAEAAACVVVITDAPSPGNTHEAGRVARLHPGTVIYAQSVDDAGGAGVVFDRLHHFRRGFLVDGALPADTWTRLARHNHECYRLRWPVPAGSPRESSRRPWDDLDEFFRADNIRQVRQVLSSAVYLGRLWRPLRAVPPGSFVEFTGSELLWIARTDHDSWHARRVAAGWRPPRAGEPEDNDRRVNASIVSWDALPAEVRHANVQHIRSLVDRLQAIGYAAVLPDGGAGHAAGYRRRGEVRAERLRQAQTWTAPDGAVMEAQPGDWRVRDEEGTERTVRDAQFRASHEWVGGHRWVRTGEVRAWRVSEPTTVLTLEGPATAAAGDWIVQGAGGERWPVPASQFERGHVACPGQPHAAGEEDPGAGPSRPGPASGDQSPGSVTGSPVAGG